MNSMQRISIYQLRQRGSNSRSLRDAPKVEVNLAKLQIMTSFDGPLHFRHFKTDHLFRTSPGRRTLYSRSFFILIFNQEKQICSKDNYDRLYCVLINKILRLDLKWDKGFLNTLFIYKGRNSKRVAIIDLFIAFFSLL